VKAETSEALAVADRAIGNAESILSINIPDQAARLAYYAQFHAAQALIFERTGKVLKTHKGVHREFHRLAKDEPAVLLGLPSQLSRAYIFKELADYETGVMPPITQARAQDAIAIACGFVATVRQALASPASAAS
jgi:uncharacterized protein (UPF0332 family)